METVESFIQIDEGQGSISEILLLINKNLEIINNKINILVKEKSKTQNLENTDTKLDKNISIARQTEEFEYSKVIPGLKLKKIITQEYKYKWEQDE